MLPKRTRLIARPGDPRRGFRRDRAAHQASLLTISALARMTSLKQVPFRCDRCTPQLPHPRSDLRIVGRTQIHNAITYANTATYATANTHNGNGQ